ncbi:unnamed protein product [Albugo candida]|uniref:Uncharacterized protein n=1 Tax=Albugo candida TaxID=65357 RepID=A0A024GEP0_9STRA|nr:unnamed protein product [Albugo candida]|eukprot:CCI44970.1 unnamed protein product [Albugo candida]
MTCARICQLRHSAVYDAMKWQPQSLTVLRFTSELIYFIGSRERSQYKLIIGQTHEKLLGEKLRKYEFNCIDAKIRRKSKDDELNAVAPMVSLNHYNTDSSSRQNRDLKIDEHRELKSMFFGVYTSIWGRNFAIDLRWNTFIIMYLLLVLHAHLRSEFACIEKANCNRSFCPHVPPNTVECGSVCASLILEVGSFNKAERKLR